jgi:hypothetical protein
VAVGQPSILVRQFDEAWDPFRTRIEGLTDDEYFWEPVEGSWTVHVDDSGVATPDFSDPAPYPPPFTTIAWRLAHIGQSLMFWADRHFGDGSFTHEGLRRPPGADEAIRFVEAGRDVWREGLLSVDASTLEEKSYDQLLAMGNHVRQHGSEVGVLRDLYWHMQLHDPLVRACLNADRATIEQIRKAHPGILDETRSRLPALLVAAGESSGSEAMELLIDLGFSVNAGGQRSPLHQAVALGNLQLVRRLVELGADLTAIDSTYRSTPLDWAEFLQHSEIIEYLTEKSEPRF